MMIFVTWKWMPRSRYRTMFRAEHVNTMLSMLTRHYHAPFELVCITDDPRGLDSAVRAIPIWDTFADIPSPHGGVSPACYRRLRAFAPEMQDVIGPRFVSVDLDVVIVDDITPLFGNAAVDFMIWRHRHRNTHYNPTLFEMNAGARAKVFTEFNPHVSPILAKKAGFNGSDMAWISYILGPDEPGWTADDGVVAFRTDIMKRRDKSLPPGAKIVSFHGSDDPWSPHALRLSPWIEEHYR